MAQEPMEQPAPVTCKGRELHWDKIARLWVCTFCGTSLNYKDWNLGRDLECRDPRPPSASAFHQLSRFWRK